ncbi:MAG: hypothetical protein DI598_04120 [Pseudopedobacter saltans]|uniref:Uncharacterized protein n=1 Tax=Pseudopedobacter saltans TaxID=151895 RepID=A0A2W5F9Y8_9SPHI|nr:MAG: hypothetical protein DI598_04120 [Pseudopedobacter saltans]
MCACRKSDSVSNESANLRRTEELKAWVKSNRLEDAISYASNVSTESNDRSGLLDWARLDSFYGTKRIYYKIPYKDITGNKSSSDIHYYLVIRKDSVNSGYEAALLAKMDDGIYKTSSSDMEHRTPMQVFLSTKSGNVLSIYKKDSLAPRYVSLNNSLNTGVKQMSVVQGSVMSKNGGGINSAPNTRMSTMTTTNCYVVAIPQVCYNGDGPYNQVICTNSGKRTICITTTYVNKNEDTQKDYIIDETGGGEWEPDQVEETEEYDEIKDSLANYPCAQAVLDSALKMKDSISQLIKVTFGADSNFNIVFVPRSFNDTTLDGQLEKVITSGDKRDIIVALNEKMMREATKEYILITMYHEAIHAYLKYENILYGNDVFKQKFPRVATYDIKDTSGISTTNYMLLSDHSRFGPFIQGMVNAIEAFSPGFPKDIALIMAKMGVVDPSGFSNDEKIMNEVERYSINGAYKGKNVAHKGKKC